MKDYREVGEFFVTNVDRNKLIGSYLQHFEKMLESLEPVERDDSGNWVRYMSNIQRSEEIDYYMDPMGEVALLCTYEGEMMENLIKVTKIESTKSCVEVSISEEFYKRPDLRVMLVDPVLKEVRIISKCEYFTKSNVGDFSIDIPNDIDIEKLNDFIDSSEFESLINNICNDFYVKKENGRIIKSFYGSKSLECIFAIMNRLVIMIKIK